MLMINGTLKLKAVVFTAAAGIGSLLMAWGYEVNYFNFYLKGIDDQGAEFTYSYLWTNLTWINGFYLLLLLPLLAAKNQMLSKIVQALLLFGVFVLASMQIAPLFTWFLTGGTSRAALHFLFLLFSGWVCFPLLDSLREKKTH